MLKLKKNKYNIKKSSELEIFLSTGMEVYTSKNNKKIINEKSSKNNTNDKIDQLISNYENSKKPTDSDDSKKTDEKPYLEFFEIPNLDTKKTIIEEEKKLDSIGKSNKTNNYSNDFEAKTEESILKSSKDDESLKKIESKDKKKKKFSLFKSKKEKKIEKSKESKKNQDTRDKKIKQKNKRSFLHKNKPAEKIKNNEKIDEKSSKLKNESKSNDDKINFDEDIKKVLLITDNLLEKLPEEVISEFIKSKDFELYERVINKIK